MHGLYMTSADLHNVFTGSVQSQALYNNKKILGPKKILTKYLLHYKKVFYVSQTNKPNSSDDLPMVPEASSSLCSASGEESCWTHDLTAK